MTDVKYFPSIEIMRFETKNGNVIRIVENKINEYYSDYHLQLKGKTTKFKNFIIFKEQSLKNCFKAFKKFMKYLDIIQIKTLKP